MKTIYTLLSVIIMAGLNLCAQTTSGWHQKQPAGEYNKVWHLAEMSDDGQTIVIGNNSNQLFISTDGGGTWNEAITDASSTKRNYKACAMSSDGSRIIVAKSTGRIHYSGDRGANWVELQPLGSANKAWSSLAMSADGGVIVAAKSGLLDGLLYMSKDGGSTWNEVQPTGYEKENWNAVAISDNGKIIVAGVYEESTYLSTDGGDTWSQCPDDNGRNWVKSAMSADGSKILLASTSRLYLSKNTGSTWQEVTPAGNDTYEWRVASMSNDGMKIIVGISELEGNGRLYYSLNGGNTWQETQPVGDENKRWEAGCINGDGSTIVVGVNGGNIYLNDSLLKSSGTSALRNNKKLSDIFVHPNPAQHCINLKNLNDASKISIYNLQGTMVKEIKPHSTESIQISDLESGVYLISIYHKNKQTESLRFVKQ